MSTALLQNFQSACTGMLDQVVASVESGTVSLDELMSLLLRVEKSGLLSPDAWKRLLSISAASFGEHPSDLDDFEAAADFFNQYEDMLENPEVAGQKAMLARSFSEFLSQEGPGWLDHEADYELLRRYATRIEDISIATEIPINGLDEKLRDEADRLENRQSWEDETNDRWREVPEGQSRFDIDHMFGGLLE